MMKKAEARKIAIDYLFNAAESFTDISVKTPIDDKGTLSEYGYTYDDCDKIKKELDFLVKQFIFRTIDETPIKRE